MIHRNKLQSQDSSRIPYFPSTEIQRQLHVRKHFNIRIGYCINQSTKNAHFSFYFRNKY